MASSCANGRCHGFLNLQNKDSASWQLRRDAHMINLYEKKEYIAITNLDGHFVEHISQ